MLRLEDLKVGMRVNPDDLDDIYYKLIILTNFIGDVGEIVYIGEPNTAESNRIYKAYDGICTVYNVDEEEVCWDE